MSRLKRKLWTGAFGTLGALAFAAPAQAEIKGDCTIAGSVKTFLKQGFDTPDETKRAVPILGGFGKYRFGSLGSTCVIMEKNMIPTAVDLTVESEGWYEQIVCGTGKALGTSIDVLAQDGGTKDYALILADEKYKVIFTNFVGQFYWHDWDKPKSPLDPKDALPTPGDWFKDDTPKHWQLAGNVNLSEDPDKPPILNAERNECMDGFSLVAVIHLDPRTEQ